MILGCIADDFTGASDAASFLVKGGMTTLLLCDNPDSWEKIDVSGRDAVVIALKTRNCPAKQAVEEALRAVRWLASKGAVQFYFKYCSTFDSTPQGNIGPVADALMKELKTDHAILCPALPANGRTVKNGILYVNGVPLAESPMKNHPLNPMWDSRLKVLMEAQSSYPAYSLSSDRLPSDSPCYLIPDYRDDADAGNIVARFGRDRFLTGGSGILEHLAASYSHKQVCDATPIGVRGKALLLAGSCSVATRTQIARYRSRGFEAHKIDPLALSDSATVEGLLRRLAEAACEDGPILIYSSDSPENVQRNQALGSKAISGQIEAFLSECARVGMRSGYTKFIVAGGETSGAVTKALGYENFSIGPSVAPGVPILTPLGAPNIRLVLKSGNFGAGDFFTKAVEQLQEA